MPLPTAFARGRAGARPEEAFAVQVVGTVLLLSQGRKLFPVALAAAASEPCMQVGTPSMLPNLVDKHFRMPFACGHRELGPRPHVPWQIDAGQCAGVCALHGVMADCDSSPGQPRYSG